ncbi:type I-E CRISPR-associated protein Cse2/CasB [Arcanobacterium canis]
MSNDLAFKAGQRFISEVARRRSDKEYRRTRSNLRRGADQSTEYYAIPYVFPALPSTATDHERTVLLRVVSLVAEHDRIPAISPGSQSKSLGQWAYEVSCQRMLDRQHQVAFDPRKPDVVGQRLAYLHTQDFEEAVRSVSRLMQIAATLSVVPPFDFASLYSLFFYWGNGVSENSRQVRMRVLRDYYGSISGAAID